MNRLVLHSGVEFADNGAVQRDLVEWRAALRTHDVLLPDGDTVAAWRETASGLLRGTMSEQAGSLLSSLTEADGRTLVLSSDALGDALTSPEEVVSLVTMARAAGVEVRVVVVVREQIGYINSLYCHRVLTLETARSFTEFATTSVPAHRFDYVASFGAVADIDGVDLVAVPYPEILTKGAGRAVLEAAGLDAQALASLPPTQPVPTAVSGPVLIGAARLLHKRMRRMAMFQEHGKALLRTVLEQMVQHADEARWDSDEFWGWDQALRRRVEEEYRQSNDIFAEFVWGTPWPEPWSTGRQNVTDLADIKPAILVDVFSTIDRLLEPLSKPPGQKTSGGE